MSTKLFSNQASRHVEYRYHSAETTKIFGFWIYLMSDCILFATLFATYAVLSNKIADGPSGKEIFELSFVLMETFLLLFSSMTYGMAILAMQRGNKGQVNIWLGLTFLFGIAFIYMELYEFYHLIVRGYGPDRSAFLSAFFTLVTAHGFHVIAGLIWILVMMMQIFHQGLTSLHQARLQCLSLFWHFLDVVWICLFTVVYLMGAL